MLVIAVAVLAAPHAAGAATSRLYSVNRDAGIPPPEKGTASGFAIAENGSFAELSGSPFALGLRFPDSLAITPDGTRAVAADAFNSATSDPAVQGFAISPAGGLAAATSAFTPLGGAPYFSAVSPDGRFAYVSSNSAGVEAFSIAGNGGAHADRRRCLRDGALEHDRPDPRRQVSVRVPRPDGSRRALLDSA